jgi:hypothetical protein
MQLRFTSFAVTSLWRDLHPQEYAHAGRTTTRAGYRFHGNRPCSFDVEAPKPGARTYTSNFTPCASGSWRL